MLEKVEDKYKEGHFEEVVNILTLSFHESPKADLENSFAVPSRRSQLLLLIEALIKTKNYSVSFGF